ANVELTVAMLEQGMPLRDTQRRELTALLLKETKPARKAGIYEYYVTMLQLGRLPEAKLKPLFEPAQWKAVGKLVDQFRGVEPFLRQNGMWPDDEEAERKDARPVPQNLKK